MPFRSEPATKHSYTCQCGKEFDPGFSGSPKRFWDRESLIRSLGYYWYPAGLEFLCRDCHKKRVEEES